MRPGSNEKLILMVLMDKYIFLQRTEGPLRARFVAVAQGLYVFKLVCSDPQEIIRAIQLLCILISDPGSAGETLCTIKPTAV